MRATKFLLLLILLTGVTQLSSAQAAPPAAPVDWRFGVIESYEDPAAANALGAAWTRVRFHWAEAQAGGPGTWTPSVSDAQINAELAAGRMVVGLLIGTAPFAWENGLPRGLWLPQEDPNNTWAVYVRNVVGRYDGRINHWIIWNEPDIGDANAPGHTWPGSVEDFFQLQRIAYIAAKQVNPNAVIHLPAFTYFWDPGYIYRFLDVLVADPGAPGNNYYFDAITAHLYFQPNSIYDIIQSFYGAVASRGIPWKPLWLVETNAPPIDDPAWPVPNWTLAVSQQEQAAFMPQAMAAALAAGAQRIAVFKLRDTPGDVAANPEPFGLVRMDGSRRPAFTAYQMAIRYLSGMTAVQRQRWDTVGQIRIEQADKTTTVLFSRRPSPQTTQVEAVASTAVLADQWGARQIISASGGVFTVALPAAACSQVIGEDCMIGGTTYYLVQSTTGSGVPSVPGAPPAATAAATATPTATPTNTPTSTPMATATATPSATATPTSAPTATPTLTLSATATAVPTATLNNQQPTINSQQLTVNNQQPTSTPQPLTPDPQSPASNYSYWLIGAGGLLGLGLFIWSRRYR